MYEADAAKTEKAEAERGTSPETEKVAVALPNTEAPEKFR